MRSLFPAERAAEEFDQVLDGTATQAVTDRYADLLDTVSLLLAEPPVLPRAEFVSDLRTRLLTEAPTELSGTPAVVLQLPAHRPSRGTRRIGTVAASLVLVGGSAGLAAASSGSLPGDGLYPVKRGVEQAVAAARLGDAATGRSLLGQATTRLAEVRSLQAKGSPDSALVAETVASFREAAVAGADRLFLSYAAGGDAADIVSVRAFTAAQMTRITALAGTSATTDASLADAADTLADIDDQARTLCGSCSPAGPLAPPDVLSAGAGAAAIDRLLVRPVSQAEVDRTAAGAAQLARLVTAAEQSADRIPQPPRGSGTEAGTGSVSPGTRPVTSTITPQGSLVPAPSSGAAVNDLVSGVTSSLDEVPTTPKVPRVKVEPDKALTDAVDEATDPLLP